MSNASDGKLDSDVLTLQDLISGQSQVLEAPLFQRRYVWKREEWEDFWTDIQEAANENVRKFMGTIVLYMKQQGSFAQPRVYWVVDGQQRLMTTYLTLVALMDIFREREQEDVAQQIGENYLAIKSSGGILQTPKVKPTLADYGDFIRTTEKHGMRFADLELHPPSANGGQLMKVMEYFGSQFRTIIASSDDEMAELNALADAITTRLDFNVITLGNQHEPQDVFDRLNDAGKPLSLSDLVKNHLFKELDLKSFQSEQITAIDTKYWIPFYSSFRGAGPTDSGGPGEGFEARNFGAFVFPYILCLDNRATKSTAVSLLVNVWPSVSKVDAPGEVLIAERIKSMDRYRPGFMSLLTGSVEGGSYSSELQAQYRAFARFQIPSVALPFFLEMDRGYREGEIPEDCVLVVYRIIESFLVRRALIGLEPTGLHAVFKKLWSDSRHGDPERVRRSLQTGTIQFPDNTAVRNGLKGSNFYARKKARFVMYERERDLATTESSIGPFGAALHIDHLMPRAHSRSDWPAVSKQQHEKHVNLWGNLILLTSQENRLKSDRSWGETRALFRAKTGLAGALFPDARSVIDGHGEWGVAQIVDRNRDLTEWALQRWAEGPVPKR